MLWEGRMMQIEVHSKTGCRHCVMAKDWLDARSIPFTLHVYDDNDARSAMYDRLGLEGQARSVPQIVVDGVRLGGYSALAQSDLEARYRAAAEAG